MGREFVYQNRERGLRIPTTVTSSSTMSPPGPVEDAFPLLSFPLQTLLSF
jgi:hypothetical protein